MRLFSHCPRPAHEPQAQLAYVVRDSPRTARIPSAPLKTLVQSLASRNNYGLTLDDIDDLPEGVKAVPTGLLIQVWEVKDEDLWVDEMRARLEKRKAERDEVRRRVPACARPSAALLTRACTGT